jgi:hypothetical protein
MRYIICVFFVCCQFTYGQSIHKDSPQIFTWADSCLVYRGYINIADTTMTDQGSNRASAGNAINATGKADNVTVSLGDSGVAVLFFNVPIVNGPGADFAVFENGFKVAENHFFELAFVEVSSDNVNYFRFPAVSDTDTLTQIQGFGYLSPNNLKNLAGKDLANYGTLFDLDELDSIVGLDVNYITSMRIVDVIGNIDKTYASIDSRGFVINDPWPTPFYTGGFDLDAVAVIHNADRPDVIIDLSVNDFKLIIYPNPCAETLMIKGHHLFVNAVYMVYDLKGTLLLSGKLDSDLINVHHLTKGVYMLKVLDERAVYMSKFVKK